MWNKIKLTALCPLFSSKSNTKKYYALLVFAPQTENIASHLTVADAMKCYADHHHQMDKF